MDKELHELWDKSKALQTRINTIDFVKKVLQPADPAVRNGCFAVAAMESIAADLQEAGKIWKNAVDINA